MLFEELFHGLCLRLHRRNDKGKGALFFRDNFNILAPSGKSGLFCYTAFMTWKPSDKPFAWIVAIGALIVAVLSAWLNTNFGV